MVSTRGSMVSSPHDAPSCFSHLQRVAAPGVDRGQAERAGRERGHHVRRGQQAGVHRAQRLLQVRSPMTQ